MSSYPPPHFFSSPSSSSSSSSTTPSFMRNPYQMNYHHAPPPPVYYPFPPPFDGSVNLNNPYIYDPTHVKHRRRTTPEQLKVLEETFKTDPKPNPALRKQLSLELGMTPRVLQVWFQNRRMKVKRLVKKHNSSSDQPFSEFLSNESVSEQRGSDNAPPSPTFSSNTTTIATGSATGTASASASTSTPPSGSASPSPAPSPASPLPYPDLTLRRSSLPLTVGFNSSFNHSFHQQQQQQQPLNHHQHHGMPWNNTNNINYTGSNAIRHDVISNSSMGGNDLVFDPLTDPLLLRRRSFTSLHRLDSHPFAPLVAAGNGLAIYSPTRQNQSNFLLPSESTSASSTSPEPHLDVNASACSSDSCTANTLNTSLSRFLPNTAPSFSKTTDVPETTENVLNGTTPSDSAELEPQGIVRRESHRSPADDSGILGPSVATSDSTKNNLGNLRPTAEVILESSEVEELYPRSSDQSSLTGLPIPSNARRLGSSVPQQPASSLQRSQSTSHFRPFFMHHHSSSTPPLNLTPGTQQAHGFDPVAIPDDVPSHMTNDVTHSHTHTQMGVIQPGCRSASFHGIVPNSDNYHTYFNRQLAVGRGVFIGKRRGIAGHVQQPSTQDSEREMHSTYLPLQQQHFAELANGGHMQMANRSTSTSLIDYSHSNAGFTSHISQYHHSLPSQVRQGNMESNPAQLPYAFPPRPLGAPLPGPLPAAGYSFGTATSNTDSEMGEKQDDVPSGEQTQSSVWDSASIDVLNHVHNSAGSTSNVNGYEEVDRGYQTRFGSLASMASVPSASEGGTTAEWDWDWDSEGLRGAGDERRGSCTGQVAELFSNLEVGSRRGSEESIQSLQSGRSVNEIPHECHPCDPNETQEVTYAVPDVNPRRDSGITRSAHEVDAENAGSTNKGCEDIEHGDDEDQRKTPSASPMAGRATPSEDPKKLLQEIVVSGKSLHGNLAISPYRQLQPEPVLGTAVHDFYNVGIATNYAIPEFRVSGDVSESMGMSVDMSAGIGTSFQYQVDYISTGARTNGDDSMLGIEHYTTTTGESYDRVY